MTVRVTGLTEMRRFIAGMPDALEKRVLRGAMRAGANIIADEARLNVPVENGDTKESIKVRVTATARKVQANVDVDDWKANWLEFGTAPHMIEAREGGVMARKATGQFFGTSVDHPGYQPKQGGFLLPAGDAKEVAAIASAQAHLDEHAAAALRGVTSPGSQPDQPE